MNALSWSPQRKLIASTSVDGKVHLWNAFSGEMISIYDKHVGEVKTVAWSPSGTLIASGGVDYTIHIWQAETGQRIFVYDVHKGAVNAVVWSSDGKYLASGSNDQTLQIWDTSNGYRTLVNCGDSERVPLVTQGYFNNDVHVTWGYVVDTATGIILTPSDYLPL